MMEVDLIQFGALGILAWVTYYTHTQMNNTIKDNSKAIRDLTKAINHRTI